MAVLVEVGLWSHWPEMEVLVAVLVGMLLWGHCLEMEVLVAVLVEMGLWSHWPEKVLAVPAGALEHYREAVVVLQDRVVALHAEVGREVLEVELGPTILK